MTPSQSAPIPEVYVLWHPHCSLGENLARRVHTWLRPGNGLGPQVFYRSLPAPEAPERGLPPPLPGESRSPSQSEEKRRPTLTNLQIVLALIDENMVADQAWRHWLVSLRTAPSGQRVVIPCALDATAYNMPPPLRELNYLRPAGLPLPDDPGRKAESLENVARSLLKQVTEAMCRVMLSRRTTRSDGTDDSFDSRDSLPKVTIFLSHAKADGTAPARRIRDYIYSQTQLAAFYDENDIAFGSVFSRVIQNGLGAADTAALIAVRGAKYATRPWCRRELSLFRRPRQESAANDRVQRWRLYPSLVVEAMEGRHVSPGIPELGNSSVIRWNDEEKDLEESIVTTVIRDAMLAAFHSAMGASLPFPGPGTPSGANRIVINWLPDPTTLLLIPSISSGQEIDVIHPGRGLSGLELDTLAEFFPNLTFRSFEEDLS